MELLSKKQPSQMWKACDTKKNTSPHDTKDVFFAYIHELSPSKPNQ